MNYELVVFDLAGTTVKDNRDVHRILQLVMREHHIEVSLEDVNEVMGIPKPVAIHKLLTRFYKGDSEINFEWVNDIHRQFVARMIEFYRKDPGVGEKEGVSETFLRLKKKGVKVAVDTGFDREITDAILERLGWRERNLIDFSVASDEVVLGRPYADMIFRAMKETGVGEPRKVIKVGDTVSDIQQGRAAACGMIVGVTSGASSVQDLEGENPHYLIGQVPELLDLMK
jgi:phosphonatase-like hydrolase